MPVWSSTLVREIAERRAIIVLGSGASADCLGEDGETKPPTWPDLLTEAAQLFAGGPDLEQASQLIERKRYLDAAEIIFSQVQAGDKSDFLRGKFLTPAYHPSDLHNLVRDLDTKIVVTTNYDRIYEGLCPPSRGYVTCRHHDTNLLNEIRSSLRVIVKAHGCVSDPDGIVLLRSEYFKARQDYRAFYSILDSLFLVNTLLFVGCGLDDPDLQLVVENANISAPSTRRHYALVPSGRHPALVKAIESAYNLKLVEYPNDDGTHLEAVRYLKELSEEVDSCRATPA